MKGIGTMEPYLTKWKVGKVAGGSNINMPITKVVMVSLSLNGSTKLPGLEMIMIKHLE